MERIKKIISYLEKEPGDSFLRHALGLEYLKLGKDEEAKLAFETVVAKDPGYVGTYYHLAKLLEKMGDSGEAIKIYEQGIAAAKTAGDNHAKNELQMALDEISPDSYLDE
jgi:Tfp pilus assembly protein PilF